MRVKKRRRYFDIERPIENLFYWSFNRGSKIRYRQKYQDQGLNVFSAQER